jgi:hypothetical protein
MIKPNWGIFKSKFNENPQNNFEWMCYLLFCQENNLPFGIFRYKNQSGIENEPIQIEDDLIGWQAKFYTVSLTERKDEIIETLKKINRDYPNLTKLIFYTNQEWSQNFPKNKQAKPPKAKTEIESKAQEYNITIVWRQESFFESSFVSVDNESIVRYFFSNENSVISLIEFLDKNTNQFLKLINNEITMNGTSLKIDRSSILSEIQDNLSKPLIISGNGGTGKTAVIKDLNNMISNSKLFLIKANQFDVKNIDELFKQIDLDDLLSLKADWEKKIFVIDSSEQILNLDNQDVFKEFLLKVFESNWSIIFTCRTAYLDNLNYLFFEQFRKTVMPIEIKDLDDKEIRQLSTNYNFDLPKNKKLINLISNPFYLNYYLKSNFDSNIDVESFKEQIWSNVIFKNKHGREKSFFDIIYEKSNQNSFYIDIDSNKINDGLIQDGIIGYESAKGYFISHDIFEEWGLNKLITKKSLSAENNTVFFSELPTSLLMRKSFRDWLIQKVNSKESVTEIIKLLFDDSFENLWKDEIIISILLSEKPNVLFNDYRDLLKSNDELIKKIAFLLQMGCSMPDDKLINQLGIKNLEFEYYLTKPHGLGWKYYIKFLSEQEKNFLIKNYEIILDILLFWTNSEKKGESTKISGEVALFLYQESLDNSDFYIPEKSLKQIFKIIINSSNEIYSKLKYFIDEQLKSNNKVIKRNLFFEFILTEIDSWELCNQFSKEILEIAKKSWTYIEDKDDKSPFFRMERENNFKIEHNLNEFPPSSFKTPILKLLQVNENETINFIINFVNDSITSYFKSKIDDDINECKVYLDDDKTSNQIISNAIWCIYRGTSSPVMPYLLQSIHMGLEKYLLSKAKNENIEDLLLNILSRTKSASISAIVCSVVLDNPNYFRTAKILFKNQSFFLFDNIRSLNENQAKHIYQPLGMSKNDIHEFERLETLKEAFRKNNLESLILKYQFVKEYNISDEDFNQRQEEIWAILDSYDKLYSDLNDDSIKFLLSRIDRRNLQLDIKENKQNVEIHFKPQLSEELLEKQAKFETEKNKKFKYISLKMWAHKNLSGEKVNSSYEPNDIMANLKELVAELNSSTDAEFHLFNGSIPAFLSASLIKHYKEYLDDESINYCKNILLSYSKFPLDKNYGYQIGDGVEESLKALPFLYNDVDDEGKEHIFTTLLLILFDDFQLGAYKKVSFYSIEAIISCEFIEKEFIINMITKYTSISKLLKKYKLDISKTSGLYAFNFIDFLNKHEQEIENIINNREDFDTSSLDNLELYDFEKILYLMPSKMDDVIYSNILKYFLEHYIISLYDSQKSNYQLKHNIIKRMAQFFVSLEKDSINEYFAKLDLTNCTCEFLKEFFEELVTVQDSIKNYETFWALWDLFYPKIKELSKSRSSHHEYKGMLKIYMLANPYWKQELKEWHTLTKDKISFYRKIVNELNDSSIVLYSVSKILNSVGSIFFDEGINWLNDLISNQKEDLDENTIYNIEKYMNSFVFKNKTLLKKNMQIKTKVVNVLNSLIKNNSTKGYLLRENLV